MFLVPHKDLESKQTFQLNWEREKERGREKEREKKSRGMYSCLQLDFLPHPIFKS